MADQPGPEKTNTTPVRPSDQNPGGGFRGGKAHVQGGEETSKGPEDGHGAHGGARGGWPGSSGDAGARPDWFPPKRTLEEVNKAISDYMSRDNDAAANAKADALIRPEDKYTQDEIDYAIPEGPGKPDKKK